MTKIIENESLQFEVFEDGSANVVKCETSLTGDLAIPAFVESEGKSYPVVSIGNKAFLDCIQLTRVTLLVGIKSVAGNAFLNCCGLESIAVSEENPYYKSEDGITWTLVESAKDIYTVSLKQGKKFYRAEK